MSHIAKFFEIPTTDLPRAKKFYSGLLGATFVDQDFYGTNMAFFKTEATNDVAGALVCGDGYHPSQSGALVYLNAGPDLSVALKRVSELGGSVQVPKTKISDQAGHFAIFIDSEGNRLAMHSQL